MSLTFLSLSHFPWWGKDGHFIVESTQQLIAPVPRSRVTMKQWMLLLLPAIVFLYLLTCTQGVPVESQQTARHRRQINAIQRRIIDVFDPKPIVDTMTEEEKYGNEVDHRIGKVVVKTVERFSNAVNSIWNIPVETVKQMSRGATEALNNLGARIVGLEK